MKRIAGSILSVMLVVLQIGFVTSCATMPTTSAGTSTSGSSATTAEENVPFTLNVIPQELKGFSIPGQRCVFLVTLENTGQASSLPADITADASNAQVIIENGQILAEQVAEVTVIPDPGSAGKTVSVTFSGKRSLSEAEKTLSFDVIEGIDDRNETAVPLQGKFTAWLAEKHPELGITAETEWLGTMVSPQWLVVSHYLFFSDEWEMHVYWHIMIAPDDWVRIDLRRRFEETVPGYAFEISSREANSDPIAINAPEEIWR